ncbi:MAG: hypothetical protein PUK70_03845 [Bacteroidales bacterium]|nr:hypothetical protein [Bacteroidales bacterium]MDY6002694.1 hypothetical protein [Candidatus Cryptobacteroides sp.]
MKTRRINASEVKDNLVNLQQLMFEVTDTCNLKCKYCGYGELLGTFKRTSGSTFIRC